MSRLGRRQRAANCQHLVFRPLHARRFGLLHAAVAAAVRHVLEPTGSLPPQRPGDGRRPPARYVTAHWCETRLRAGCSGGRTRPGAASGSTSPGAAVLTRGLSMPHSTQLVRREALGLVSRGSRDVLVHRPGTPAITSPSPKCRALPMGSTSPATSPSSACRREKRAAVFSGIPVTERLSVQERTCGVCVIDLRTGCRWWRCCGSRPPCRRSSPWQVLPGRRYPDSINDDNTLLENSFVVPDAERWPTCRHRCGAPAEPARGRGGGRPGTGGGGRPWERAMRECACSSPGERGYHESV